jgi:hypothetical protein
MNGENVEIAVYLAPTSQYMQQPGALSSMHKFISYQGKVGELQDVHLVSVTKANWDSSQQEILGALRGAPGVIRVEAQQQKQRSKRKMDEF